MTIYSALVLMYDLLLLATCAYAWLRGGSVERAGAAAMFAASTLSVLIWAMPDFRWHIPRGEFLLLEIGLLAVLLTLALRSNRFWPLWATAFQLIAATTQVLGMIEPAQLNRAYVFLQGFWAYPILICIVIGTRRHQQRAAVRHGNSSADSNRSGVK